MSFDEFQQYKTVYGGYIKDVTPPDLFVYLRTSSETLMKRIEKRGRDYEKSITVEYLEMLGRYYDKFFHSMNFILPGSNYIVCETESFTPAQVHEEVLTKINFFLENRSK